LDAVRNYQRVEADHRSKEQDRVKRQLLIVKPDARPDEIKAVQEGGGQQIFAQAVSKLILFWFRGCI
jgi:syntaxin 1B/2/3